MFGSWSRPCCLFGKLSINEGCEYQFPHNKVRSEEGFGGGFTKGRPLNPCHISGYIYILEDITVEVTDPTYLFLFSNAWWEGKASCLHAVFSKKYLETSVGGSNLSGIRIQKNLVTDHGLSWSIPARCNWLQLVVKFGVYDPIAIAIVHFATI